MAEEFRAMVALPDLAATMALGARIAACLKPGDAVALAGALGAGKTTLARAILRALGVEGDVPSPSFTLVQPYETQRLPVSHYDLYRLTRAEELDELGLDEALEEGAVLMEWPERAALRLPVTALHIHLESDGAGRRALLRGPARWRRVDEAHV